VFRIQDVYRPAPGAEAFALKRVVTVEAASSSDHGFASEFRLSLPHSGSLANFEIFVPGVWYRNNDHIPPGAIGSDYTDRAFLIREDRMSLPLCMMRNASDGETISLIHLHPDGKTSNQDNAPRDVIDDSITVGSLGPLKADNGQLAVAFCMPAREGERSYLGAQPIEKGVWIEASPSWLKARRTVRRFHRVHLHAIQQYDLLIVFASEPAFAGAMRHVWRLARLYAAPGIEKADLGGSYRASLHLLSDLTQIRNDVPGIITPVSIPDGEVDGFEFEQNQGMPESHRVRIDIFRDTGAQHIFYPMGFTGQQTPNAYHLLRGGLKYADAAMVTKGQAIIDFWVKNAMTPQGLPRTIVSVYPRAVWGWDVSTITDQTFMRGASDGMVGVLMAWNVMQMHGSDRPDWLMFCRRFGDWLLAHQRSDGSWSRSYTWDDKPSEKSPTNTAHPIRFLIDLSEATGDVRYRTAALRAGEFCWRQEHLSFHYVGGTEDNPNVMDKEAGFMALDAFHALHDATDEPKWLAAAEQAADFIETWCYCWNIPIPGDDVAVAYPRPAPTSAFSLIATGHSGADLFMAGAAFMFYRLYVKTGDAHYQNVAELLLHNTKHAMDIGGSLGYAHEGLCTEALTLAPSRGHGIGFWGSWLTYSMIEPIAQLEDVYGISGAPKATADELTSLRAKDREYAASRGFAFRRMRDMV
jgi:hypothetical protein